MAKKKSKKGRKAKRLIFGGSYPTRGNMGKGGPYFITMPPQEQTTPGVLEKLEANAALLERGMAVAEKYMKGPGWLAQAGSMAMQGLVPLAFHGFAARDAAAKEQAAAEARADTAGPRSAAQQETKTTEQETRTAFAERDEIARQEEEVARLDVKRQFAPVKRSLEKEAELGASKVDTAYAEALAAEKQKQDLYQKSGSMAGTVEAASEKAGVLLENVRKGVETALPNQYTANLRGSAPDDIQVCPSAYNGTNFTVGYNTSIDFDTSFQPLPKKSPEFMPAKEDLAKRFLRTPPQAQVPPNWATGLLVTGVTFAAGRLAAKINIP